MHLKRIELEGFKSFADRTVIPVEKGLTGIVGPNGCGKSNIVDALLWVMGERSAKALRAAAMDDVIFQGTSSRAAGAYAMVEVVLGDPEGLVVEPGGEVAVGRRLFSTGESEFLLHGRKVRRKDVREILLDTGLGVQGYMVLAQGKIDAVLDESPEKRRSIFEEAAGISRYKARKHETQLKLKHVERDLEQVDSVLKEVSRSVRSLRAQAGKAERFIELRDDYRTLRVKFTLIDNLDYQNKISELREKINAIQAEISSLKSKRDQSSASFAQLEEEANSLRQRHDSLKNESSEVKEQVAALEERISQLDNRTVETGNQLSKDTARLESLKQNHEESQGLSEAMDAEKSTLDIRLAKASEELKASEALFEAVRVDRNSLRDQSESLKNNILQVLQERTHFNNQIASVAKDKSAHLGSIGIVEKRLKELEEERGSLQVDSGREAFSLEEQKIELKASEASYLSFKNVVEALRDKRRGFAEVLHSTAQKKAAAEARVDAFAVVESEMPGVPEHLRTFYEQHSSKLSWLLDVISVPEPYDRVLENLLGRMQHSFWSIDKFESFDNSEGVFDFFTQVSQFLTPQVIEGTISLYDLMKGEEDARQALCARLGDVYCVDSLSLAQQKTTVYPHAIFLVATGEILSGGYSRKGILNEDAAGVLARRNGKEAALLARDGLAIEWEAARDRERDCVEELEIKEKELEKKRENFVALKDSFTSAEKSLSAMSDRCNRVEEEYLSLEKQYIVQNKELDKLVDLESEVTRERDERERLRVKYNLDYEQLELALQESEVKFDSQSNALQEFRLAYSKIEQEMNSWQERYSDFLARSDSQSKEKEELEAELKELDARGQELCLEVENAKESRTELLHRRMSLEERLKQAAVHLERVSAVIQNSRAESLSASEEYDNVISLGHSLELEIQREELSLEELMRGFHEEFSQPLDSLVNSMAVDRSQIFADDIDVASERERMKKMRQEVEKIGSVNLEAVNELEESEERETFLQTERDDLVEAKASLENTLSSLDVQCRDRFVNTFDKVKIEFEALFRRLFRGGKAELSLASDCDPLEAGIDILGQPPGKKMKSLKSLSGGERTLTALALLLAVFKSRPSPFCLLDEVDAALDDTNVERFVSLVQDFMDTTQFLVVTHNRITMARCQRLFGVTMRKKGVSMVVGVDLEQISVSEEGEVDLDKSSRLEVDAPRRISSDSVNSV
jgi:chromosome segregation protein